MTRPVQPEAILLSNLKTSFVYQVHSKYSRSILPLNIKKYMTNSKLAPAMRVALVTSVVHQPQRTTSPHCSRPLRSWYTFLTLISTLSTWTQDHINSNSSQSSYLKFLEFLIYVGKAESGRIWGTSHCGASRRVAVGGEVDGVLVIFSAWKEKMCHQQILKWLVF